MHNKAIKVTRYTRRFWYEVWCALLVQCGAPYRRRYGIGSHRQRGVRFLLRGSSLAAIKSLVSGDIPERFSV
ncbi:hypothetical protein EIZ48_28355 [Photobacterium alginatilyticum]|uniref:Uncharacterized protein n=1 Tax=Photobacterium alginatilyticum TaxID=1775171 RepID=A0ABW9YTR8_9GAMM|nr:hypothetical protein [Photobacterium alginatilyticum]